MEPSKLRTTHRIVSGDARHMGSVPDQSVQLVVTSPPYPMIEMWDEVFSELNPLISSDLITSSDMEAFELMHLELDKVWEQIHHCLEPGGIACINIGDATRSIEGNFRLFTNHSRIIQGMVKLGFHTLPGIIWNKPTNAPNKFLGSGMLPVGAYVTLEHEHILVFRKGTKKDFNSRVEKERRSISAFFWEERNSWFSDFWQLKGTRQKMHSKERDRSAAFPIEVPFRLVNMYSQVGDLVLDPFSGTGTTSLASIGCGRNSIGYEVSGSIAESAYNELISTPIEWFQSLQNQRLEAHKRFVKEKGSGAFKHLNTNYEFLVKTRQETEIKLPVVSSVRSTENEIEVFYQ